MSTVRHVFVSAEGGLLPRWVQAFPKAVGRRFGEGVPASRQAILVWVRLRDRPATECLNEIRQVFGADVSCIVLSDVPRDEEAITCFSAAARGYCNTHSVAALLRKVADVVIPGGLWVGESLMQRMLHVSANVPPTVDSAKVASWDAALTKRECQVAREVAIGASNKEIARTLGITERTVKAHISALLDKLGVRDRLQLSLVVNGHRRS